MIQNTNYGASKTYVNTKVDKLTTSGFKAYTHDGATQGEIDVSNTYTPATLALRDSNGRLVAADPANGATDKSLVTANWVSQTGDSAPNNLMHKNGNETIDNIKSFTSIAPGPFFGYIWAGYPSPSLEWVKIASCSTNTYLRIMIQTTNAQYGEVVSWIGSTDTVLINKVIGVLIEGLSIAVCINNNVGEIYIKVPRERNWTVSIESFNRYRGGVICQLTPDTSTHVSILPDINSSSFFNLDIINLLPLIYNLLLSTSITILLSLKLDINL